MRSKPKCGIFGNDRLLANEDPTDVLLSSFTCIVLNWYLLPLGLGKWLAPDWLPSCEGEYHAPAPLDSLTGCNTRQMARSQVPIPKPVSVAGSVSNPASSIMLTTKRLGETLERSDTPIVPSSCNK